MNTKNQIQRRQRIWVLTKNKNVSYGIRETLENQFFDVQMIRSDPYGLYQLSTVSKNKPSLIIYDWALANNEDSYDTCYSLRNNLPTLDIPLIVIANKRKKIQKNLRLDIGADAYLIKPFTSSELLQTVKTVLSQTNSLPSQIGRIDIDHTEKKLIMKGKETRLSPKEYELLKCLIHSRGRFLSREYLFHKIWQHHSLKHFETRTLDMHITKLRKKLDSEAKRIITVKDVGYRFDGDH